MFLLWLVMMDSRGCCASEVEGLYVGGLFCEYLVGILSSIIVVIFI